MRMGQKRFILWDHDGVLVDTERWYFAAIKEAIAPLGVDFDQLTYLKFMADGLTYWDLATARGATQEDVERQRGARNRLYQDYLRREAIEIPGVEETLAALRVRFRMAVVTNSRREDFDLIHRERTIMAPMEFVLTSDDCVESKPHPEPYLTALARFGGKPSEAVVIEDSARGLKSAIAAGIDCIIIRHPFTAAQDFTGACGFVDSIGEIPSVLAKMNGDSKPSAASQR